MASGQEPSRVAGFVSPAARSDSGSRSGSDAGLVVNHNESARPEHDDESVATVGRENAYGSAASVPSEAGTMPGYVLGPGIGSGSMPQHPGTSYVPRSLSPNPAALGPPPTAADVPLVRLPHHFVTPRKRITSKEDIEKFQACRTGGLMYLGFIVALNDSVQGKKISDECHVSLLVEGMVRVLRTMTRWVEEIPPVKQPARYGNVAFRDWQRRLQERGPDLVAEVLPDGYKEAIKEIFPYFADSFGNAIRIDYGTGHEANFAAFLLCLARLGLIGNKDYQALVTRVFVAYLSLMRKLQLTYWLEPAGSHGVWGLDDYSFLPFIFGSSQLVGHKYMKPKSIHNEDVLRQFEEEYFYLAAVKFVKQVKKGLLQEHSPMINDISGVPTWQKVNGGMLKMYKVEVLEKVPIMQHFLFGSLIAWE